MTTTMTLDRDLLDHVAASLEYPNPGTSAAARAGATLRQATGELAAALAELGNYLDSKTRGETEERYSRLFDLSPVCTLDAGYHLFGDAYQRGALLAELMAEMGRAGLDPGSELPDYLPNLLRLAGRLEDPEDARLLLAELIVPALDGMKEALGKSDTPWTRILTATRAYLASAAGGITRKWAPRIYDEQMEVFRRA